MKTFNTLLTLTSALSVVSAFSFGFKSSHLYTRKAIEVSDSFKDSQKDLNLFVKKMKVVDNVHI